MISSTKGNCLISGNKVSTPIRSLIDYHLRNLSRPWADPNHASSETSLRRNSGRKRINFQTKIDLHPPTSPKLLLSYYIRGGESKSLFVRKFILFHPLFRRRLVS